MRVEHLGLSRLSGSLLALEGVRGAAFDELAEITLDSGERRQGRVVLAEGDRVILQVFQGTRGISLGNARTWFTGRPLELPLSGELLGRVFDGAGRPLDGLGEICPAARRDINGSAINPVSRQYPRDCIHTGISAIDGCAALIRGQKLPIFSAAGLPHDQLAAQIVRQARVEGQGDAFAVVFAALGATHDTADFFRRSFEESGVLQRVVLFLNLASDPILERILTPRCALTAAEYLAFDLGFHVLVVMTDMTAYCEAVREFSASRGEIPSRKGFPAYLYSDLASLYERAGMIRGRKGSVTQVPVLTMPGGDITHPIPDLTGYITEGQIVLDPDLDRQGIYPPVALLPSLSRLMKDGVGEGYTRAGHLELSNQLFASYARVREARSLAGVIGEEELGPLDRQYLAFGRDFESLFIRQDPEEARTLDQTLDLGWKLLTLLPPEELDRVSPDILAARYVEGAFRSLSRPGPGRDPRAGVEGAGL